MLAIKPKRKAYSLGKPVGYGGLAFVAPKPSRSLRTKGVRIRLRGDGGAQALSR